MFCDLILSINTVITAVVMSVSIESPASFLANRFFNKTCVKICPAGQQRRAQWYRLQTVRQELVYAGSCCSQS